MKTKNSREITPHSRFPSTGEILLQSFFINLICYGIEMIHCCISYICLAVVIIPNRKNLKEGGLLAHSFRGLSHQFTAVGPCVGGLSSYPDRTGTRVRQNSKAGWNLQRPPRDPFLSASLHFLKVPQPLKTVSPTGKQTFKSELLGVLQIKNISFKKWFGNCLGENK